MTTLLLLLSVLSLHVLHNACRIAIRIGQLRHQLIHARSDCSQTIHCVSKIIQLSICGNLVVVRVYV